jgi:hypothetical protein
MQTVRPSRRMLSPLSVSLSAALACIFSLGCSSNGSSFGTGGSGSEPNPTGNMAGTNGEVTNVMGGSTSNPTQATGGNPQTSGGGSGDTAGTGNGTTGGTGDTGGTGNVAGTGNMAGTGTGGSTTMPTCPKGEGKCHEFIANDNGKNQVNYVNEFTGAKWSTPVGSTGANSPRTIEIVDNSKAAGGKAVMVSVNTGYVEIDLSNGTKLLEVKAQSTTNVTGACRLADGTTALGVDTKIVIVNASGVPTTNFNLPTGPNLRAINLDRATGHYWLSKTETVYELNAQGQQLWSASMGAGTKGYAVWWRAGGGVYATTGEPATIVEIDANKQIVSTVGGRDNPDFSKYGLDFFSGFVRRPNGNYIVANWLGHLGNPGKDVPMVIELKPNGASGEVVWTWGSVNTGQQTITNVYVFQ